MMITKMLLLKNKNYVFGLLMPGIKDKGQQTFVVTKYCVVNRGI